MHDDVHGHDRGDVHGRDHDLHRGDDVHGRGHDLHRGDGVHDHIRDPHHGDDAHGHGRDLHRGDDAYDPHHIPADPESEHQSHRHQYHICCFCQFLSHIPPHAINPVTALKPPDLLPDLIMHQLSYPR